MYFSQGLIARKVTKTMETRMKKKKVSLMMTYPSVLWRSQIIVCFQVIEQINYTIIMHCDVITIEYIAIKAGIMSAI